MRDKKLVIIAVAIIAIILAGEAYIYTFNADSTYHTNAVMTEEGLSYEVGSNISSCYDIVYSDNGMFSPITEYYLYYDSGYKDNIKDIEQPIGSEKLDQGYYVSQLQYQLKNRGVEFTVLNAEQLAETMTIDLQMNGYKKGLICVSGALPDTVYVGDRNDLIFDWIREGGCIYWVGSLIGSCYSTPDKIVEVQSNYQKLFFGVSDCLNTTEISTAHNDITVNDYRHALSLSSNDVRYGIDISKLQSKALAVGFQEEGYSSITMVENGSGMICVIGGDYSNRQRADLAQIIASHICYDSEIIEHVSGSVTRGSHTGTIEFLTMNESSAYIYMGGYYLEYGRNYCF